MFGIFFYKTLFVYWDLIFTLKLARIQLQHRRKNDAIMFHNH